MTYSIDDLHSGQRIGAEGRDGVIGHVDWRKAKVTVTFDGESQYTYFPVSELHEPTLNPDLQALLDLQLTSYRFTASDGHTSVAIRSDQDAALHLLNSDWLARKLASARLEGARLALIGAGLHPSDES